MGTVTGNPDALDEAARQLVSASTRACELAGATTTAAVLVEQSAAARAADAAYTFRRVAGPGLASAGVACSELAQALALQASQLRQASGTDSRPIGISPAAAELVQPPPAMSSAMAGSEIGVVGDPTGLHKAADQFSALATDCMDVVELIDGAARKALADWGGVRAEMFVTAAILPTMIGGVWAEQFNFVPGHLRRYADALHDAQYQFCSELPNPYEDLRRRDAQERAIIAEEQVAVAFYGASNQLTIPGYSPTPSELLSYIQQHILTDPAKNITALINAGFAFSLAPGQVTVGMQAFRAWDQLHKTIDGLRGKPGKFSQKLGEALSTVLQPQSREGVQKWLESRQNLSNTVSEALKNGDTYKALRHQLLESFEPTARMLKPIAKAAPYLGIPFAVQDLVDPQNEGARGDIDRIVAAAELAGAALALVALTGVAAAPLGIAVATIGVVAGTWQVGSLVWDNRQAIAEGTLTVVRAPHDIAATMGRIYDEIEGLFEGCSEGIAACQQGFNNMQKYQNPFIGMWEAAGEGLSPG